MVRDERDRDKDSIAALRESLDHAPGINQIKGVTNHPRGGFSAQVDWDDSHADALVAYIEREGYLAVM